MSVEVKRVTSTVKEAVEDVKKRVGKTLDGFQKEIQETHKTMDVVDGFAKEFQQANAELRALLGEGSNSAAFTEEEMAAENAAEAARGNPFKAPSDVPAVEEESPKKP
jgi:hypothetical protein